MSINQWKKLSTIETQVKDLAAGRIVLRWIFKIFLCLKTKCVEEKNCSPLFEEIESKLQEEPTEAKQLEDVGWVLTQSS